MFNFAASKSDIYKLAQSIFAKGLSAIGILTFQFILARYSGEEALGEFSSILSVLFLIGIVARFGGAEVFFKDARSIEMEFGKDQRYIFTFKIMYQTVYRGILITFFIAAINHIILPSIELNSVIDNKYYYIWFIAPFFALAPINANYFYLENKNIIAGLSELGGIAFISSLIIGMYWMFSMTTSGDSMPLIIYVFVLSSIAIGPIITHAYLISNKPDHINNSTTQKDLLQMELFVYFGQWGIIAAISLIEASATVAIFAVCMQISTLLDFFIRVAGSVYSHKIKYAYENMTIKDFACQIQDFSRAVAIASTIIFIILLVCAEVIFEAFGFKDERFFFIFYVLILARFLNSLFGLTDAFLIMTKFQREYKWIIISTSSIAICGALLSSILSIEVVSLLIAASIVLRNIIASIVIYIRSGLIMIPLYVSASKKLIK